MWPALGMFGVALLVGCVIVAVCERWDQKAEQDGYDQQLLENGAEKLRR